MILLFLLPLLGLLFDGMLFWHMGQPPMSEKELTNLQYDLQFKRYEWDKEEDTVRLPAIIVPARPGLYALQQTGRMEIVLKRKMEAKRERPSV